MRIRMTNSDGRSKVGTTNGRITSEELDSVDHVRFGEACVHKYQVFDDLAEGVGIKVDEDDARVRHTTVGKADEVRVGSDENPVGPCGEREVRRVGGGAEADVDRSRDIDPPSAETGGDRRVDVLIEVEAYRENRPADRSEVTSTEIVL